VVSVSVQSTGRSSGGTPEEFASQLKNDIVTWNKVMKDANIPVN
jgi:tripartite-type tricarboxylate transporter receptor subunit TctC